MSKQESPTRRLGDFEFPADSSSLIGEGGFSRVYRAKQVSLERPVALKVMDLKRLDHPSEVVEELAARFENEARLLAQLQHPNVVSVIQAGREGELLYLAMELVEGHDLSKHLQESIEKAGQLSVAKALEIGVEVVRGLSAAYDLWGGGSGSGRRERERGRRVIHRDVKPTNILISQDGQVKLTDFGLARLLRAAGDGSTRHSDKDRLTKFGSGVGTPTYMAPEAFDGLEKADQQSDIYSFGVVLYELLANAPPFSGGWEELCRAHHSGAPEPVREIRPEVPEGVEGILARCLQKRKEDRYQSYSALLDDLETAKRELEGDQEKVGSRSSREPEQPASAGWARLKHVGASVVAALLVGSYVLWLVAPEEKEKRGGPRAKEKSPALPSHKRVVGLIVAAIGIGGAVWVMSRLITGKEEPDRTEGGEESRFDPEKVMKSAKVNDLWRSINLPQGYRREEIFDPVVGRFLSWSWDLPASEEHHHSEPGGLARHSIDTALRAVRRVAGVSFRYQDARGDEDPGLAYQAADVWRYAAFVFGLFHDIGKCTGFRISRGDGRRWNAFVESLEGFWEQGKEPRAEFKAGRGKNEHEALTPFLLGRILPDESIRLLTRFDVLSDILKELAHKPNEEARCQNARLFLSRVKAGDMASALSDRRKELPKNLVKDLPQPEPAARAEGGSAVRPAEQGELHPVAGAVLGELEEGLKRKEFQTNNAQADLFVGKRFVCLPYPRTLEKLLARLRSKPEGRKVLGRIRQPRDLVTSLDNDSGIVHRPSGRTEWKVTATVDAGSDKVVQMDAVLLIRERLPEACQTVLSSAGEVPAEWAFRFFLGEEEVDVPDFKRPAAPEYDGQQILAKLKAAVLQGKLTCTGGARQVYIAGDWSWFVSPACLNVIFGREEVEERAKLNAILNALGETGAVMKDGDRVLQKILPGSVGTPLMAVAVATSKLFEAEELSMMEERQAIYFQKVREIREVA